MADGGGRAVLPARSADTRSFSAALKHRPRRVPLLTGVAAIATVAVATVAARRFGSGENGRHPDPALGHDKPPVQGPARRLDQAAALLAAAALSDSAMEHYRGSFHNKFMYVPLAVSAVALAASVRDAAGAEFERRWSRAAANTAAFATGIVGTGFHLYNITKRPGGFSWLNLFYAAPLGAPAALSLAGLLGAAAHRLRGDDRVPSGRLVAALVSLGLFGTTGEAALLHFRGAYHNPAMLVPVTLPPVAATLLARSARRSGSVGAARLWLQLLTAVGFLGSAFHAYGIRRNMGGWRNWSQNLLNGPPLPAPPAFTALAIAGLASLDLIEGRNT
jgi:hypothetical protein